MAHSDPTFRTYLPTEAARYAAQRLSYPRHLYEHVLAHHARTGGAMGTLLDVGCGPGNATRDVALAFDQAIGIDPGEEMIQEARRLAGVTKTGEPVRFEVCAAEQCATAPGLPKEGTDLLIAAMAFWAQAARAAKPGGTVALWTVASNYAHPDTPNAAEVNRLLLHFERETLSPYEAPGNRISRDMYDNLPLPWTVDPVQSAFPEATFTKDEWDRDGMLTGTEFFASRDGGADGGSDTKDPSTAGQSLEELARGLGTASMVTRWRAAHPELVGTDQDCVQVLIEKLRPLLGGQRLRSCGSTAILFFKRK